MVNFGLGILLGKVRSAYFLGGIRDEPYKWQCLPHGAPAGTTNNLHCGPGTSRSRLVDLDDLWSLAYYRRVGAMKGLRWERDVKLVKNGKTWANKLPHSADTVTDTNARGRPAISYSILHDALSKKASVVWNNVHHISPSLNRLCASLERQFHAWVSANAYLTPAAAPLDSNANIANINSNSKGTDDSDPPNRASSTSEKDTVLQGFDAHRDIDPVLIVQLQGTKKWILCADALSGHNTTRAAVGVADSSLGRVKGSGNYSSRSQPGSQSCEEIILRRGDVLYVPAAQLHDVFSMPLTATNRFSLHLTIAIRQERFNWKQFLERVIDPEERAADSSNPAKKSTAAKDSEEGTHLSTLGYLFSGATQKTTEPGEGLAVVLHNLRKVVDSDGRKNHPLSKSSSTHSDSSSSSSVDDPRATQNIHVEAMLKMFGSPWPTMVENARNISSFLGARIGQKNLEGQKSSMATFVYSIDSGDLPPGLIRSWKQEIHDNFLDLLPDAPNPEADVRSDRLKPSRGARVLQKVPSVANLVSLKRFLTQQLRQRSVWVTALDELRRKIVAGSLVNAHDVDRHYSISSQDVLRDTHSALPVDGENSCADLLSLDDNLQLSPAIGWGAPGLGSGDAEDPSHAERASTLFRRVPGSWVLLSRVAGHPHLLLQQQNMQYVPIEKKWEKGVRYALGSFCKRCSRGKPFAIEELQRHGEIKSFAETRDLLKLLLSECTVQAVRVVHNTSSVDKKNAGSTCSTE